MIDCSEKPTYTCDECGELCEVTEETFDYSATHCTNGHPGTHYTGYYSSDCCGSTYQETNR